jgi:hypothetical protein
MSDFVERICYLEDRKIYENRINTESGKISCEDVDRIRMVSTGRLNYWWCYTLRLYCQRDSSAQLNTYIFPCS